MVPVRLSSKESMGLLRPLRETLSPSNANSPMFQMYMASLLLADSHLLPSRPQSACDVFGTSTLSASDTDGLTATHTTQPFISISTTRAWRGPPCSVKASAAQDGQHPKRAEAYYTAYTGPAEGLHAFPDVSFFGQHLAGRQPPCKHAC